MYRCIQLARQGLGNTYPNPLVGSVIIHKNIIIGEGWHRKAGLPHAEVNAIRAVENKSLLKDSTIYVNLEPCSHFGKTPPCADLIISEGIKKVVIGSTDPNPKVAGRGIERLQNAGCNVIVGVRQKECDDLNKRFFTFHKKKRPYIILKWAQTEDGFIAPKQRVEKKPVWISNKTSRQFVHKMRAEENAIMVGTNTVLDDNPSLTTRDWSGKSPTRVLIDRELKVPDTFNIYDESAPTIVLTQEIKKDKKNVRFVNLKLEDDKVDTIIDALFATELQSVIVEGGAQTIQSFVDAGVWDEAYVFEGAITFGNGIKAPDLPNIPFELRQIGTDMLKHYKNLEQ